MGKAPGFVCELSDDNYKMVRDKQTELALGRSDKEKKIGMGRCNDMLLTELRLLRLERKKSPA